MRNDRIRRWLNERVTARRSRGQALVELALILPVMLLLFASALDLGRLFYSQVTIDNAAKEGALEAARNPTQFDNTKPCNATTNRVICLVINEAKGSFYTIVPGDVSLHCSVTPCPADPVVGNTVTVSVIGRFSLVTPILAIFTGGQDITLHSSATAQVGVEPNPAPASTPTPSPTPAATATPIPTATPVPTVTPIPTASPIPTPTPTPVCLAPIVTGGMTVSPSSGKNGAKVPPATNFTFTAPTVTAQPGCSTTYSWSFGDGASGNTASVSHFYLTAGSGASNNYTVSLSISTVGVPTPWTATTSVVVK